MKKLTVFLLLLSLTGILFAQNSHPAGAAVIAEMTGTVELKRSGSEAWVAASAGDVVEQQTYVSTGFKSTAVLVIGSTTLTVRPLTRLRLDELVSQGGEETAGINLGTGRVRADVKPPAGTKTNFTVQSPTATASVRGTVFEMDTVSLKVIEGAVSFAPSDAAASRPVSVGAGQESWVDTDTGGAVAPMAAAEAVTALPVMAGQAAAPPAPETAAQSESSTGNLNVNVGIGGNLYVNIEVNQ